MRIQWEPGPFPASPSGIRNRRKGLGTRLRDNVQVGRVFRDLYPVLFLSGTLSPRLRLSHTASRATSSARVSHARYRVCADRRLLALLRPITWDTQYGKYMAERSRQDFCSGWGLEAYPRKNVRMWAWMITIFYYSIHDFSNMHCFLILNDLLYNFCLENFHWSCILLTIF